MDNAARRPQTDRVTKALHTHNNPAGDDTGYAATRRVAIVGPFPPIRSGIAKHTEAIAQALERRDGVTVKRWGFSRQYPGFLYPGQSERDPEQPQASETVQETLDGANPLSWSRTLRDVRAFAPDLVVMPAWTFAVAPALGWIAKGLSKAGVEVCLVVHNAFDHEVAGWKDRLTTWQLSAADRFVTHNQALADEISQRYPSKSVQVFPHPVFDDVPTAKGTLDKRGDLELLFFGLVRHYKGLDVLLDAVERLESARVMLTVAGEFWQGLEETKARLDQLGPQVSIDLIPRYVGDAEMAELFHRADAVVLPYHAVSGSGVVSIACHYRKAVIASDLPGFAEIIRHGETGWLFKTADAADLARTIDGLDRAQLLAAGEAAGRFGQSLTWDRFADVVLGQGA